MRAASTPGSGASSSGSSSSRGDRPAAAYQRAVVGCWALGGLGVCSALAGLPGALGLGAAGAALLLAALAMCGAARPPGKAPLAAEGVQML